MTDPYTTGPQPDRQRRASDGRRLMANASLILGILAIATVIFVYTPLIFGGISIVLGLLSRGGAPKCNSQGRVGIIISLCAFVILAFVFCYVIWFILGQYGSIQGFYEDYMEKYTYTMNQLLNGYQ